MSDIPSWLWAILGLVVLGLIALAFFNRLAGRLFGDAVADVEAPLADGEVERLLGHTGGVTSIGLSADGSRLLSGSKDGTFRLWSTASGQALQVFRAPFGSVMHVALSPDGSQALVLCNLHRLRELRALLSIFSLRTGIVPNATRSAFFLWDLASNRNLWSQSAATEFNSVVFAPDGRRAAAGGFDGTVRVYDLTTRAELFCLGGHQGATTADFSSDGQRLITTGHQDRVACLWDMASGERLRQFRGHTGDLFHAGFSPDGRQVVTAAGSIDTDESGCEILWKDCTARIWDTETGQEVWRLLGHEEFVFHAVFAPNGQRILTDSGDRTIRLWDAGSGKELKCYHGHSDAVTAALFSADGRFAYSAGRDHTIRKWELPN